ncbi:MAG: YeeE/YedE family protein [Proteobacteria bacterium]|nr:YeeE/YedE family protein [Pseudomonadota bacterium]
MLAGATEILGESGLAAIGGLAIGLLFGFAAQRSRFCLRAATLDFWRGQLTDRVAVWVLAFSAAVMLTQAAILLDLIDLNLIRSLNQRGSLSGAIIGGAMFGTGMVLTRGCASRLLVLSAGGNLRSVVTGLIFAVTAQASLRGWLSPIRDALANAWTISDPGTLSLITYMGARPVFGLVAGAICLGIGLWMALHTRLSVAVGFFALIVGLGVAAGWTFTALLAGASFDPQPVKSLSFTGPSAATLMQVLTLPVLKPEFDIGLVPGVLLGAFLGAAYGRDLKLEGFSDGIGMRRYIIGAVLMGFGGMLAGGCAIGAGVSGASVFATISWLTLLAMWVAAGVTDAMIDRAPVLHPEMKR